MKVDKEIKWYEKFLFPIRKRLFNKKIRKIYQKIKSHKGCNRCGNCCDNVLRLFTRKDWKKIIPYIKSHHNGFLNVGYSQVNLVKLHISSFKDIKQFRANSTKIPPSHTSLYFYNHEICYVRFTILNLKFVKIIYVLNIILFFIYKNSLTVELHD